jgi:MtfA peptidase
MELGLSRRGGIGSGNRSSGTVVLAWDSVEHGARNPDDGRNVTFHEIAHQLVHEDGDTDGAPTLSGRAAYRSWARFLGESYAELRELLEVGKRSVLNPYGATEPAEFFAVATETFFEKSPQLYKRYPELYSELESFYQVSPREWLVDRKPGIE